MEKSIQQKKTIGIIGAGNVGTSLAISISEKKFNILFNSSHYDKEVKNIKNIKQLNKFISFSDIIFIAKKDKDIKKTRDLLLKYNLKNKIIFHLSGVYSSEIIKDLKKRGAKIGSSHPVISIPEKFTDLSKIKFYLGFDGDKQAKAELEQVFNNFNVKIFEIKASQKPFYHLAITLLCNYPFFIMKTGQYILTSLNLNINFDDFKSTVTKNSLENYLKSDKISGPLMRKDYKTINREIAKIKDKDLKVILKNIIDVSSKIKKEFYNES